MNDELDPFEVELLALRPQDLSPGLRRRVAERLAEAVPAKRRRPWRLALAGCLAAACVAAVCFWWASRRRFEREPLFVQPVPPAEVDEAPPTVLTYRLALARSPEELDALLDTQAVTRSEPHPQLVQVSAFTQSESALHALLGDD
jgi:hypothetical protein